MPSVDHRIVRFQSRFSGLLICAAAAIAGVLCVATGSASASYSSTVLASNPISYYRLEETTGTTTADLGTLGLTANFSATGVTLNQTGIPGGDATNRGILLNGSTGFATVAGTYTGTAYPLTIEAFVKTTSAGANLKIAGLTNNGSGATTENVGVYVQNGKAALRIRSASGGDQSFQGGTPVFVNDGFYHQIVGVFTSATSRALYVDGNLVTTSTANAAFPNINSLDIGALARSSPADFLSGSIDEVSVYNTALSAGTITSHFLASGIPEPTSFSLLAVGLFATFTRRHRSH